MTSGKWFILSLPQSPHLWWGLYCNLFNTEMKHCVFPSTEGLINIQCLSFRFLSLTPGIKQGESGYRDLKKNKELGEGISQKITNAVTANYEAGCVAPGQGPRLAKFVIGGSLQLVRPGLLVSQDSKFLSAFFISTCSTLGISCARRGPEDTHDTCSSEGQQTTFQVCAVATGSPVNAPPRINPRGSKNWFCVLTVLVLLRS